MFAILWSHGSGFELGGVFEKWDDVIKTIAEDSPDNANVIKFEIGKQINEDNGGLYDTKIFEDGAFVGPDGEQLEDEELPPGPDAYEKLKK